MTRPVAETWAVVPAKHFAGAKSRLREVAAPGERAEFAQACLRHVLQTLVASRNLSRLLVLTDAPAALPPDLPAHAVLPDRADTFAGILADGARHAFDHGAARVLICVADLPWLTVGDVDLLTAPTVESGVGSGAASSAGVVLAPDTRDEGTNALLFGRDDHFSLRFGRPDSFPQHRLELAERGLEPRVVRSRGLGFDVDEPADWVEFQRTGFSK